MRGNHKRLHMRAHAVDGRLSRRTVVGGLAAIGASAAGLAIIDECGMRPFTIKPRVAHVGYLWTGSSLTANLADALRAGLLDAGWVEGQTLVIEERTYGGDHPEHIPDLAAELVALKPNVLLA